MENNDALLQEIQKRRASSPAYLLLTDEEIAQEIQSEAEASKDDKPNETVTRTVKTSAEGKSKSKDVFVVTVDYSQTLAQLIEAGQYDWKNSDINARNFKIKGEGEAGIELKLIHLKKIVSTGEALRELEVQGLRPATLPELLVFGASFPEQQLKYPIIALGSSCKLGSGRSAPYLWSDGRRRYLGLGWLGTSWDAACRFLAARK